MRFTAFALTVMTVCGLSAARAEPPPKPAPIIRACPPALVWSEPKSKCVCPGALRWDAQKKQCTAECPAGKVQSPNAEPGVCVWLPRTCAPGKHWSELHDGCVVVCPAGKAANKAGTGCVADPHNCPEGTQWFETRNACFPFCAPGRSIDYAKGTCVDDPRLAPSTSVTPTPSTRTAPPKMPPTPTTCPEGKEWKNAWGGCVPQCNDDEVLDFQGLACHPVRRRR